MTSVQRIVYQKQKRMALKPKLLTQDYPHHGHRPVKMDMLHILEITDFKDSLLYLLTTSDQYYSIVFINF